MQSNPVKLCNCADGCWRWVVVVVAVLVVVVAVVVVVVVSVAVVVVLLLHHPYTPLTTRSSWVLAVSDRDSSKPCTGLCDG